jgi:hypothetical protein
MFFGQGVSRRCLWGGTGGFCFSTFLILPGKGMVIQYQIPRSLIEFDADVVKIELMYPLKA